jgi:hypothetical protein
MAQDDGNLEGNSSQDRQQELEAGFLDWLGSFGPDASIDDLAASVVPVVDAAKDPQG